MSTLTSVLVTGASRGIGLELVKKLNLHPNPPSIIFATCRSMNTATELMTLAEQYSRIRVLTLDVTRLEDYAPAVAEVTAIVGEQGLNILINNAGLALKKNNLEEITYDEYLKVMKTNTLGPVFVTQAFLPLLKKAALAKPMNAKGLNEAAVMNISSVLGTVSMKQPVVWAYNESKAALNQVSRSMATAFVPYGVTVFAVHPGWVRTDMGGQQATLSVEESVAGLINLIYSLTPSYNDKFLRYDGSEMPY